MLPLEGLSRWQPTEGHEPARRRVYPRFLIHVLPDGFRRIRYYGFLANSHRARKLALRGKLLRMTPPTPAEPPADYGDRYQL